MKKREPDEFYESYLIERVVTAILPIFDVFAVGIDDVLTRLEHLLYEKMEEKEAEKE